MRSTSWWSPFCVLLLLAPLSACRQGVNLSPAGPFVPKTECHSCSEYDDFSRNTLISSLSVLGEWVIQTDLDWYDFQRELMGGTEISPQPSTPPVDLTQKTLLVKMEHVISANNATVELVPNEICFGPDRVTVRYDMDEPCGSSWYVPVPSLMIFAIDKTDLPVVWEGTFYPYDGPPCEPVTTLPPFYPRDPWILYPHGYRTHVP